MAEDQAQRRLAAIMAADVAGYSRLMSLDEDGTLASFNLHLTELLEPEISRHNGRIFKLMGDGLLAEFSSVIEAVHCAVSIQRGIDERNRSIRDKELIAFRVGINLGDVIAQGDDLFGDGHVAARLEGLADPGGICISRAARDQIRDKLDYGLEDWGEVEVKNIPRPIRVFRVLPELQDQHRTTVRPSRSRVSNIRLIGAATLILAALAAAVFWFEPWLKGAGTASVDEAHVVRSGKPSVAVLPFTNMSDSKEQEYFSDGLAEDMITDLSRISGLTVISRTSSFTYKGRSLDIRTIGKELGALYIVEGSVRKIGNQVRITTQLIDAGSGKHIWADRFDRPVAELFDLQDQLRGKIVETLKVQLTAREERWLARKPTQVPEAYDLYLRGLQQVSYFSQEGNLASRQLFQQAIDLDPEFAAAYAQLALAYGLAQENRWTGTPLKFAERALGLAQKAVALDDELPQAHWALGRTYSQAPYRDFERALAAVRRVVALNPNYADGHALLASTLNASGRSREALEAIGTAMRINPNYPFWYLFNLGLAQFNLEQFEVAAENFKKVIERNPTVPWPHRWLVAAYGHLGLIGEAEWEISELQTLNQKVTIEEVRKVTRDRDAASLDLLLDGLRKAGVPES